MGICGYLYLPKNIRNNFNEKVRTTFFCFRIPRKRDYITSILIPSPDLAVALKGLSDPSSEQNKLHHSTMLDPICTFKNRLVSLEGHCRFDAYIPVCLTRC